MCNFRHWVGLVVIILNEGIEQSIVDVELDGVISSRDGLDIEINEVGLLDGFDVVKVDQSVQVDEHSQGSAHESVNLSVLHVLCGDFTSYLSKHIGSCSTVISLIRVGGLCRSSNLKLAHIITIASCDGLFNLGEVISSFARLRHRLKRFWHGFSSTMSFGGGAGRNDSNFGDQSIVAWSCIYSSHESFLGIWTSHGQANSLSSNARLLANDCGPTEVTKGISGKHQLQSPILEIELNATGLILAVQVENRNHDNCDASEHEKDIEHHIEVSIHSVAEREEWLLHEVSVAGWHLDVHLVEQSFPEGKSKIRLLLSAPPAWLQERQDLIEPSSSPQRVEVFDIHEGLVDLLSGEDIFLFGLSGTKERLHELFIIPLL